MRPRFSQALVFCFVIGILTFGGRVESCSSDTAKSVETVAAPRAVAAAPSPPTARCADKTNPTARIFCRANACNATAGETQQPAGVFFTDANGQTAARNCANYKRYLVCDRGSNVFQCVLDLPGCISVTGTAVTTELFTNFFETLTACTTAMKRLVPNPTRCIGSKGPDCLATCTTTQMIQPRDDNPPTDPWTYDDCITEPFEVRCYNKAAAAGSEYSCTTDNPSPFKITPCPTGTIQVSNSLTPEACATYVPPVQFVRCVKNALDGATCRPAERIVWKANDSLTFVTPSLISPLTAACNSTGEKLNPTTPYADKATCEAALETYTYCYTISTMLVSCVRDYECTGTNEIAIATSDKSSTCGGLYSSTVWHRCIIGRSPRCRPAAIGCLTSATASEEQLPVEDFETEVACNQWPTWSPIRCLSTTGPAECLQSCTETQMTQPTTNNPPTPTWSLVDCWRANFSVRCYDKNGAVGTRDYSCVSDVGTRCGTKAQVSNSLPADVCSDYSSIQGKHVRCVTTTAAFCRPSERITWSDSNVATVVDPVELTNLTEACKTTERLMPSTSFESKTTCENYPSYVRCYSPTTLAFTCTRDFACSTTSNIVVDADDATLNDCGGEWEGEWYRCIAGTKKTCRPSVIGCLLESRSEQRSAIMETFETKEECDTWSNTYLRCLSNTTGEPVCTADKCTTGHRLLNRTLSAPYETEQACQAELYIGKLCYTVSGSGYTTSALSDHGATFVCPAGSRLIDQWFRAATLELLEQAADAWYTESQTLSHHRCKTSAGEPVCRPDMNAVTGGNQCPTGETILPTANTQSSWSTLGECLEQLYWARPCYRANTSSSGFYSFSAALDTSTGCVAGVELALTNTSFYSAVSAEGAIAAAASRGSEFYPGSLGHYQCQFDNSGDLVTVCRPRGFTGNCPTGEVPVTSTLYPSLSDCRPDGQFALKPCYRATQTGPNYFDVVSASETSGGCVAGDVSLSDTYEENESDTKTFTEAEITTLYKSKTTIMHVRCKVRVDAETLVPVCRPDMDSATEGFQCDEGDEGGAVGALLANNPVGGYAGYEACMAELYFGKSCYIPSSSDPYYTIETAFDHESNPCPAPGAFISSSWISGDSEEEVADKTDSDWYDDADITHIRCKVSDTVPMCRPSIEGNCPGGENKLENSTWTDKAGCDAERYHYKACYNPTSTPPDYFTIVAMHDTQPVQDCGANQLLVGSSSHSATEKTEFTESEINTIYKSASIPHFRCKTGTAPVCRPDMSSTTNGVQCASVDDGGLLLQPGTDYANLEGCRAELYWGRSCYEATSTDPFFEVSTVFDHESLTGCSADSGVIDITEPANGWVKGNESHVLDNTDDDWYQARNNLEHIRCRVDETTPMCRPKYSGDACPGSEEKLGDDEFTGYSNCLTSRYGTKPCYHATTTGSDLFTFTIGLDTRNSNGGCPTGDISLSAEFTLGSSNNPTFTIADDYSSVTINHYRCKVTPDGGDPVPVCRPGQCSAFSEGELNQPGTAYANFGSCHDELFWGRSCYEAKTDGDRYDVTTVFDHVSKTGCAESETVKDISLSGWVKGSQADVTEDTDQSWYDDDDTIPHIRCKVDASTPICRPVFSTSDGCPNVNSESKLPNNNGGDGWAGKSTCENNLFFAKPCYSPLQTAGNYYDIVPVYDTEGSSTCDEGDVELSSTYEPSSSANIAFDEADEASLYTNRADLPHYRCKVGSAPVCRPIEGCDTVGADAAAKDDNPLQNAVGGYANLSACNAELYWAKACYRATDDEELYDIVAYGDTETQNDCATDGNEIPAGSDYSKAASLSGAKDAAEDVGQAWYDAGNFNSRRCKITLDGETNAIPICRPTPYGSNACAVVDDGGALPSSSYTSMGECLAKLYQFHACYHPEATEQGSSTGKFFTIVPGFDTAPTSLTNWCPAGDMKIGTTVFTNDETVDATFEGLLALDSNVTSMAHSRCQLSSTVAACRPNMTASTGSACASGETPLTTAISSRTSWTTFALCNVNRLIARPCYHPTETEQTAGSGEYYTVELVLDTQGSACAAGDMPISTTLLTTATDFNLTATIATLKGLKYNRCKISSTEVTCRPNMTAVNNGNTCAYSETLLASSIGNKIQWTGFDACNVLRFAAKGCYQPTATPQEGTDKYYIMRAVSDLVNTAPCETGELVVGAGAYFASAPSSETLNVEYFEAILFAQTHYRCKNVKDGVATVICRPTLASIPGNGPNICSNDSNWNLNEGRLSTSVGGNTSWTAGYESCKNARFAATGCYRPTRTDMGSGQYYSLIAGFDHNTTTPCGPGELQISTTFTGRPSVDQMDLSSYDTTVRALGHNRCRQGSTVVCRPSLAAVSGNAPNRCSNDSNLNLNEALLSSNVDGLATWATGYAACMEKRFAAAACYRPRNADDNGDGQYYTIAPGFDHLSSPACAVGEMQLSTTLVGRATKEELDTFAFPDHDTNVKSLPHNRCRQGSVVVCRPSLATAVGNTPKYVCANDTNFNLNESPLATNVSGLATWTSGFSACMQNRYAAVPCYRPLNEDQGDGEYYSLVPGFDHTTPVCGTGELQFGTLFVGKPTKAELDSYTFDEFEAPLKATGHNRCKQGNVVVCRPSLAAVVGNAPNKCSNDSLGLNEAFLGTTVNGLATWTAGFEACMASRYAAAACYRPLSTEQEAGSGEYYSLVPGFDHIQTPVCQAGEWQVNTAFVGRPTKAELDTFDFPDHDVIVKALAHNRCKQGSIVVCRPTLATAIGNAPNKCSNDSVLGLNEALLGTNVGGLTTWAGGFSACMQNRYAAAACYHPESSEQGTNQFYTFEPGFDHIKTPVCGDGELQVNTTFVGRATVAELESYSFSEYDGAVKALAHYRCLGQDGTIICRPTLQTTITQLTGNHCSNALQEVYLTTKLGSAGSWVGFDNCMNVRFLARACYKSSAVPVESTGGYYTLTAVYDTDSPSTCTSTGTTDVAGFLLSGPSQPITNFAPAITNLNATKSHVRCRNPSVTSQVICRPDLSAAVGFPTPTNRCAWDLDPKEILLSSGYTSVGNGNCGVGRTFQVICYNQALKSNFHSWSNLVDSTGSTIADSFAADASTFQCSDDFPGCAAAGLTQLITSPVFYNEASLCTTAKGVVEATGKWIRCTVGQDVVRQIICRPTTYLPSAACSAGETKTSSTQYGNVDNCTLAAGDTKLGVAGVAKCCCEHGDDDSRILCGKMTSSGTSVTGCTCTDCEQIDAATVWSPVRLGELFMVYQNTTMGKISQPCPL